MHNLIHEQTQDLIDKGLIELFYSSTGILSAKLTPAGYIQADEYEVVPVPDIFFESAEKYLDTLCRQ